MIVGRGAQRILLIGAGLAAAAVGAAFSSAAVMESWLLAFVILSGLAAGSLALLMIGHLLGEHWLEPVRSELEAAALTMPLLALFAIPLALGLSQTFSWAAPAAALNLPPPRAAYLQPDFFLVRGALYLALWSALAWWITHTRHYRSVSAVGIALLAPTLTLAGVDWVMSRDPEWWSSVFGFAFSLSQMVAALAGAIFLSLVRLEHPSPNRLRSLERALLILTLLALWVWFVQFLVVWAANVPGEVAWYADRADWLWLMLGVVLPALFIAVAILIPPGVGRATMAVGSALLLVHHAAYMIWLIRPAYWREGGAWPAMLALAGIGAIWGAWFAIAVRDRPNPAADKRYASSARA
jgi:hypothetical protein